MNFDEVTDLYNWYWTRFLRRVTGLTDDEYLWEPARNCWTVRPTGDRTFAADFARPEPDPPPVTTIAWQMTHLGARPTGSRSGMAATGATAQEYVSNYFAPDGPVGTSAAGTAAEAIQLLTAKYENCRASFPSYTDDELKRTLREYGVEGSPFSDASFFALILHVIDEEIHHMSEVGLLRDLYRAR